MIGAPNSPNLNSTVRVMKEAPDSSVSEEIADIFHNYYIDRKIRSLNIVDAYNFLSIAKISGIISLMGALHTR